MNGGLDDFRAFLLVQLLERLAPFLVVVTVQQSGEGWQRLFTVCHNGHVGLHILVYLAGVDIQMDNLGLLGIGLGIARHTVGETHADGNQHVTLLLFQVDGIVAMHS